LSDFSRSWKFGVSIAEIQTDSFLPIYNGYSDVILLVKTGDGIDDVGKRKDL
jgi:hypothetical protein